MWMKRSTISVPVPAGPIEQADTRRQVNDTSRPVFAPSAVPGPSRLGLAFESLGALVLVLGPFQVLTIDRR
jgi:hypothetical protein